MPNVTVLLKPSKQFIALILGILVGSVIIIFLLPITLWAKVFCTIFILIYGSRILWRYGFLFHAQSIRGFQLEEKGIWQIHQASHKISGTLCDDSTVTHFLCVLRFAIPGQRTKISCIVFKDAVRRDDYRQLLILLRNRMVYQPKIM